MKVIGKNLLQWTYRALMKQNHYNIFNNNLQNKQRSLHKVLYSKRSGYLFSNDKKNPQQQQNSTKSSQPSSSNPQKTPKSQTQQVQQLSQQQFFNLYLGFDKNHSFKNDLIVSQQKYKKQTQHLKQAILFEDLLKSQIDILIYDTNGKPFYNHLFRCFLMIVSIFGTYVLFNLSMITDKKFKVVMEKSTPGKIFKTTIQIVCGWLCLVIFWKHLKMTKRFVEKIVYHTETQSFTFTKRKAWGGRYNEEVSRFKILYTQNPTLNKKGTNYLNIQNQHEYSIGYLFAWKKQDLFSHLISQRIKT